MQTAEEFLFEFFSHRNALFERHRKELEAFQTEFQGFVVVDKFSNHEGEHIVETAWAGDRVKMITNGYRKGPGSGRMRYELVVVVGGWLISDIEFECPICKGTGKWSCKQQSNEAASADTCKVCKGLGWCSLGCSGDDTLTSH